MNYKVISLRMLKSFLLLFVKLALVVAFCYGIYLLTLNTYFNIRDNYNEYIRVRGIEKYGDTVEGSLVQVKSRGLEENIEYSGIYEYTVKGETYTCESTVYLDSKGLIPNITSISYDILEPTNSVDLMGKEEINNFYIYCFETVGYWYMLLFGMAVILGFLWFMVDVFNHSKKLWKIYA